MGLSSAYADVRWWAAIALLIAGCSSKGLITAKGFVRCDGEPVASGAISFHPAEGTSAPQGSRVVAGRFRIRIPRGRYRVQIVATRPQQGGVELTPGMPRQEQYIPSRYNAASVLEAHANGWWWNHFAFDLSTAEAEERPHPTAADVLQRTLDVDFDHGGAIDPGLSLVVEAHGR